MGRAARPEHKKLDTLSPLRLRATPGHRMVWLEMASEFGMTETAFARTSLLLLLHSISKHEPQILNRAVKRANRCLLLLGYPPVTPGEILAGEGLPERGLLTFSGVDETNYNLERPEKPVQRLKRLLNVSIGS